MDTELAGAYTCRKLDTISLSILSSSCRPFDCAECMPLPFLLRCILPSFLPPAHFDRSLARSFLSPPLPPSPASRSATLSSTGSYPHLSPSPSLFGRIGASSVHHHTDVLHSCAIFSEYTLTKTVPRISYQPQQLVESSFHTYHRKGKPVRMQVEGGGRAGMSEGEGGSSEREDEEEDQELISTKSISFIHSCKYIAAQLISNNGAAQCRPSTRGWTSSLVYELLREGLGMNR